MPSAGCACGYPLSMAEIWRRRLQGWELPEVRAQITEYPFFDLTCLPCGRCHEAEGPQGMPRGQGGHH
jgi:hypothetical protein